MRGRYRRLPTRALEGDGSTGRELASPHADAIDPPGLDWPIDKTKERRRRACTHYVPTANGVVRVDGMCALAARVVTVLAVGAAVAFVAQTAIATAQGRPSPQADGRQQVVAMSSTLRGGRAAAANDAAAAVDVAASRAKRSLEAGGSAMVTINATQVDEIVRAAVSATLDELAASTSVADRASDNGWILSAAFVVLTMQAGFGVLESGMVSTRNAVNIMMKNIGDSAVGAVGFWAVGYSLAYGQGDGSNAFVGAGNFMLLDLDPAEYPMWIFQFAFAATGATIVSGSVVGRMYYGVYVWYSFIITSLLYPVAAHWVWAPSGWLYQLGFIDLAGDGPVHLLGGSLGLVTTKMLGARNGVFTSTGEYQPFRSSPVNVLLGVFLLWFSWFAFNAGSTLSFTGNNDLLAGKIAANTAVAAATGTIAAMLLSYKRSDYRSYDIYETATGLLAGLVAITAPCANVEPWEAAIIGTLGGVAGIYTGVLAVNYGIDDPVGVVPVHLVGALVGLVATGLFARPAALIGQVALTGLFHGGGFELLGVQVLGAFVIMAWGMCLAWVVLKLIERFGSPLRVPVTVEEMGLDAYEHDAVMMERMVESEEKSDGGYSPRLILTENPKEPVYASSHVIGATQNRTKLKNLLAPQAKSFTAATSTKRSRERWQHIRAKVLSPAWFELAPDERRRRLLAAITSAADAAGREFVAAKAVASATMATADAERARLEAKAAGDAVFAGASVAVRLPPLDVPGTAARGSSSSHLLRHSTGGGDSRSARVQPMPEHVDGRVPAFGNADAARKYELSPTAAASVLSNSDA